MKGVSDMNPIEVHDTRRDLAAACLSLVPGLGHMYKGL